MSDGNLTSITNSTALFGDLESRIMEATGFSQTVTDIVTAALIFTAFLVLARIVRFLVSHVGPMVVSKTQTTLDDEIIKALNGPAQWLIATFGTYLALHVIGEYTGFLNVYLDELLLVTLIFIMAYLVANLINGLLNWYKNDIAKMTESNLDDMLVPFLQKIIDAAVVVIAIIMALDQLDIIEITPLITGLGVLGVAVALAAQQFLSDFFGAISIMVDRPYKVGDRVRIQGIDTGDVVEIGLRSTRIRTMDNRIVIVPNAKVSKSKVINMAVPDASVYVSIKVGIAYDADVVKATRIMEEIALSTEGVIAEPRPKAFVTELGNYAVRLTMFPYINSYRLDWAVPDKIYRNIVKRFAAEGIEIPMPITNVEIRREGLPATFSIPAQPPQTDRKI
jgi:Small-conductance mechanosensitive channel